MTVVSHTGNIINYLPEDFYREGGGSVFHFHRKISPPSSVSKNKPRKGRKQSLWLKMKMAGCSETTVDFKGTKRHYLLTYGAQSFFRSPQLCSHSRTSQHFMESEGSIPCSHEPSTGPYPEPYKPCPHNPILYLVRSILILSTHLRLGLPSGIFTSGFPTNVALHPRK
jgi:hypothetical protein